MAGVKMPSCEEQDEKIKCIAQVRSEYDGISSSLRRNRFICPTDAALYYGLVRAHKPRRIIEIGARFSTVLACGAVERNGCGTVIAIDPYPPENIRKKALIVPLRVQDVPLREFTALQHGDMLFIDSSHVAQIGSDVLFEILEILPRLNSGVMVHFHDILLPASASLYGLQ